MNQHPHNFGINRKQVILDKIFHILFFMCAIISVLSVILIIFNIFNEGLKPFLPNNEFITKYIKEMSPTQVEHFSNYFNFNINNYKVSKFLFGMEWHPNEGMYGIGFMIISSIVATAGAILVGVPIGVLTAVFIAEIASERITRLVRPAIELLAAIPSVLYGVFGVAVIVPMISNFKVNVLKSPNSTGTSLLAVVIVLSIMVLPTIIAVCETSIRAVPRSYKEGSLALGASKMQTIFKVILPAAKSGILTGIVLGVGRAIGETMAVILVAGNPEQGVPTSLLDPVRLLTTNIALEQGYAAELHSQMLFSTAIVLFFFIMIVNFILQSIKRKLGEK